jgi:hypothetical protein
MTPEEVERMNELCKRIETEKDHKRFSQLLAELNKLLEGTHHRLGPLSSQTDEPKS